MEKWPVFICYRQSDGKDAANAVYDLLHGQEVTSIDPQTGEETAYVLDVYFDQTAPVDKDWTAIHEPYLKRSRAFIIICTPGVKLNEGQGDWVHEELDWWLQNNEAAPILIDALGEDDRYVPEKIAERWPNAQRIALVPEELEKLDSKELAVQQERTRARLIGGITTSGEHYLRRELEEQKERAAELKAALDAQETSSRRFKRAFVVAVALLAVAAAAMVFGYDRNSKMQVALAQAEDAQAEAEDAAADAESAREFAELEVERTARERNRAEAALEDARRERQRADEQAKEAFRQKALRDQHIDPVSSIAAAYGIEASLGAEGAETRDQLIRHLQGILIDRRASARRRFAPENPAAFRFYGQALASGVFSKFSADGRTTLIVTTQAGGPYEPEKAGEVYLLDNQTLNMVELAPCTRETRNYRVEFADFAGDNAILVSRAFYVELYKRDGTCLARDAFQLQETKTPVTAAGGMLYDVTFVAGNGSGCVWVEEYGNVGLVEPDRELSAVANCDEKDQPDAVLSIEIDPSGRSVLNLFQSGRIDYFALDGLNGRPKRRAVLAAGAIAAVFRPGAELQFAIAVAAEGSAAPRVEAWHIVDGEPQKAGELPLAENSGPIDFFGFSRDGRNLVALDTGCLLHVWDYETRELLAAPVPSDAECL